MITKQAICLFLTTISVFSLNCPLFAGNENKTTVRLIKPEHAQSIYRHLIEIHGCERSGLFTSFPDSNDRKLTQQASTYEQAAMGLLAIRMGDLPRARRIFEFFKTSWTQGPLKEGPRKGVWGLVNFYNVDYGSEGIEKRIHLGPNAWAGLMAARLANKTKDAGALAWALDVAYWARTTLRHENGAVAMGPRDDPNGTPWTRVFSTENNLSYYAMLTELLRSPALEKETRIALTQERDGIEQWLLTVAVNPKTLKVVRGISPAGMDPVQALDTVTWLVSAVGPRKLSARGLDPHELMIIAADAFEVKVRGRRGVDPTDTMEATWTFAHDRAGPGESTRPDGDGHRMIWFEGLGQYLLALGNLAEFAHEQGRPALAQTYETKMTVLTREFDLAAIDHYPGTSAYPYATPGKFFRDGWRTPPEAPHGPASSLISGIWRSFAGLGFDPMAGRDLASIAYVDVRAPEGLAARPRKPGLVFGTSEDMIVAAWRALAGGDEDLALEQAQATISEWAPWAAQLQQRKMRDVGRPITYAGDPSDQKRIFSYWALNDVGAAYFLAGKILDGKKDHASAARAFQQIMTNYSLAQVWDDRGWFWSPADAVQTDFVANNPEHYDWLVPQDLAAGEMTGKHPF